MSRRLFSIKTNFEPSQRGYSLLELILVIVLSGIIVGIMARMLLWGIDVFDFVSNRTNMVQSSRIGMKKLEKDLLKIKSSDDINSATSTMLNFTNLNNQTIVLNYDSGKLTRNTNDLLQGLDSFYFTFYDAGGDTIPTPVTDPTDIWKIKFRLLATVDGKPWNLESMIKPRNIW
ncbi:MAG: prepilin-type N-terminal cleavage/methylation domain-containing protein [bacterium]